MSRRAQYLLALALLAGGGLGLVVDSGLTWQYQSVAVLAGGDIDRQVAVSGQQAAPLAAAAGWVALASVAGVLATRGIGRRIVSGVAVLAGLAAVYTAVGFGLARDQGHSDATAAWVVATAAGIAVTVAGGWVLWRGASWPTMGSRYERRADPGGLSTWQQQDLGLDPTGDDGLVE